MTAVLEIRDLGKRFVRGDQATVALRNFNLTIDQGSFVTILGRSGCGKSTMLNLLSGLTRPSAGTVSFKGKPHDRPSAQIGYLTQSDTLMPWRDLSRNIEMPMEIQGLDKATRRERARALIERVGLQGFEHSYPRELSGGMRRRASLARMLASGADTFLMDEPFGALDAQLRSELQADLMQLWQGSESTIAFVTHDIEEAIILADRCVVLGPLGTILLDAEVDIRRPRDLDDVRTDPTFVRLYERLSDALKKGAQS